MSRTFKDSKEYRRPDGRGRYRSGSRRRRLKISAEGVVRENPDLQRLGRAIIDAALRQAELEVDATKEARGSEVEND